MRRRAWPTAAIGDWAGQSTGYVYLPDATAQQVTNGDGGSTSQAEDNAQRLIRVSN